jgi:hypothetical protein
MKKNYSYKTWLAFSAVILLLIVASCKKENNNSQIKQNNTPTTATPTKFGLYETDSSIYKLLYTYVAKIGTLDVSSADYYVVFDTGSGGLVIDASGILPASMITTSGFNFTGDSTVVNGITIYNQKTTISYGDDANTTDKVYGYLAYAPVTIGDDNGNIVIKRLPFFLYYKAVDGKGNQFSPHEFDVLGVSSEYDATFPNNAYITSPFSYFDPGTGLTKGFKMAALTTSNFSYEGTYVPDVVTLGLTASDLSSAGGFSMSQLSFVTGDGYAPVIPVSLTYNSKAAFKTYAIFDTGTEPYNYIEDTSAADTALLLPNSTSVSLSSTTGFNYAYLTSSTDNLTYVENPKTSQSDVSVLSLEFFLNNEYLLDFTNHQMGLKSN